MYSEKFYQARISSRHIKIRLLKKKIKRHYINFLKIIALPMIIILVMLFLKQLGLLINLANTSVAQTIANIFINIYQIAIDNLALIFCISTVLALTDNPKIVFSAIINFVIFSAAQHTLIHFEYTSEGIIYTDVLFFYREVPAFIIGKNIGLNTVDISIIGGIILGIINVWLYTKLSEINLPKFLSYYNGWILIILAGIIVFIIMAIIMMLIWIAYALVIVRFSNYLGNKNHNTPFLGLLYGFIKTLTLPLGIRNLFNNAFGSQSTTLQYCTIDEFRNIYFIQFSSGNGWLYNSVLDRWNNNEIQAFWEYLKSLGSSEDKIYIWKIVEDYGGGNTLPISDGRHLPIFEWCYDKRNFNTLRFSQNYAINFAIALSFGAVLLSTTKKENRLTMWPLISSISLLVFISGDTTIFEYLIYFYLPWLYLVVFIPLNALNAALMSLVVSQVGLFNVSYTEQGLLNWILEGIIPKNKGTNFYWTIPFALLWSGVIFIFYWKYITKYDIPVVGRAETLVPHVSWRQWHNIWNH